MNTNFKVIGLTRLGIKPESTAPEADDLTTQSFELLKISYFSHYPRCSVLIATSGLVACTTLYIAYAG